MAELALAEVIELFHVAFLEALSRWVERSRFVLKGGANLHCFFGSLRYSEDIDVDLRGAGSGASQRPRSGRLGHAWECAPSPSSLRP